MTNDNFELQEYNKDSRNIDSRPIRQFPRSYENTIVRRDIFLKKLEEREKAKTAEVKPVANNTNNIVKFPTNVANKDLTSNVNIYDSKLENQSLTGENGTSRPIRVSSEMLEEIGKQNSTLYKTVVAKENVEKIENKVERKYDVPEVATSYPRNEIVEKENSDIVDREFSENLRKNEGEIRSMNKEDRNDRFESYHESKPSNVVSFSDYGKNRSEDAVKFSDDKMENAIRNYSDLKKKFNDKNNKLNELNATLKEEDEKKRAAEEKRDRLIDKYIKATQELQNLYDERDRQEAEQRRRLESTRNDISRIDRDIDRLESNIDDEEVKRFAA